MKTKKHPKTTTKPLEKTMKTNKQEITTIETALSTQTLPSTQRTGFFQNIMPVLGKDGETVYLFLPGEMTIAEPANRFKGLLGIPYTPKSPTERSELKTRYGFHAKIRIGLSQDKQWVTIYLPGNLGRIVNHINAYNYLFGIPYEKKTRVEAKAVA
jgi:hypothetical protein